MYKQFPVYYLNLLNLIKLSIGTLYFLFNGQVLFIIQVFIDYKFAKEFPNSFNNFGVFFFAKIDLYFAFFFMYIETHLIILKCTKMYIQENNNIGTYLLLLVKKESLMLI